MFALKSFFLENTVPINKCLFFFEFLQFSFSPCMAKKNLQFSLQWNPGKKLEFRQFLSSKFLSKSPRARLLTKSKTSKQMVPLSLLQSHRFFFFLGACSLEGEKFKVEEAGKVSTVKFHVKMLDNNCLLTLGKITDENGKDITSNFENEVQVETSFHKQSNNEALCGFKNVCENQKEHNQL